MSHLHSAPPLWEFPSEYHHNFFYIETTVLTGLPTLPVTASAVGLERRRAADLRLTTLRPCVRRTDQPTLAAHSAAHPV